MWNSAVYIDYVSLVNVTTGHNVCHDKLITFTNFTRKKSQTDVCKLSIALNFVFYGFE